MTHNHIILLSLLHTNMFSYVQELLIKVHWKVLSSLKIKYAKWIAVAYFYLNVVPKRNYLVNPTLFILWI